MYAHLGQFRYASVLSVSVNQQDHIVLNPRESRVAAAGPTKVKVNLSDVSPSRPLLSVHMSSRLNG